MKHKISSFHYITQDLPEISHQELTLQACEAGIDWVQLRIKNKPHAEWLKIAREMRIICNKFNARLIINDNVEITKLVKADGVHLGKKDMSVNEARKILGRNYIIGGTANNLEEVEKLINSGVDYIGLGPFQFTNTKENLSPILGINGISNILTKINNPTPIIGIGGVKIEDLNDLLSTGLYGVAVSSAINKSADIGFSAKNFLNEIDKIKENEQVNNCR